MRIMLWNCQGATSSAFKGHFLNFIREFHPSVVAMFEARISGSNADRVISSLGFDRSFKVEAQGFRRDIWLIWKVNVEVNIIHMSNQSINMEVQFQFTTVYASPSKARRSNLWQHIGNINLRNGIPWLIGGDFNVILSADERRGGALVHNCGSKAFSEFSFCKWGNLYQGLDRCVGNSIWTATFLDVHVLHLDSLGSDHQHSLSLVSLLKKLNLELESVMDQEESLWRQKACSRWILQGDRNTKFFHTSVVRRRCANRISALKRNDGSW
ncbi:uncharacterized protein LOC120204796 [Hibiscus syriacus]|uniref:uncharacterized protein LOC120204796 n=1 Tax=Hibiscus syriacus TaxID=106335 RepID=UPI001922F033|nr:uncharacterized protein LOC120204796 [Hibiscus syriacus]